MYSEVNITKVPALAQVLYFITRLIRKPVHGCMHASQRKNLEQKMFKKQQ